MIRTLAASLRRVRSLFRGSDTLAERIVSGGVWLSCFHVVDRGVRFATFIALSHFLSPAEFGLLGLAMLALTVLQHVSQLGIDAALIQHEDSNVDGYLDTAWVLSIARGLAIALAALVLAPQIATVFDNPRLSPVIRVLGLTPLIAGLRNPGVIYLRKELAFDRQFSYALSETVVFASAAIGVTLVSPSVWALVAATLAGKATKAAMSYVVHPYRPGFSFNRGDARELLDYGRWVFGSGFALLALNWGDDALVGLLLGSSALGLYQMAFRLASTSVKEVTDVVSGVAFPAFSQVQHDTAALREAYYRSTRLIAYISLPMAVGIAAIAPVFVQAFLGSQWRPVASVMRVMAVWGAFRSLVASVGPLFRAIGKPAYNTVLQVGRLLVLAVVIYPATTIAGIYGTALALVISGIIENPVSLYVAVRSVSGNPWRLVRSFIVPAGLSMTMGTVVVLLARIVSGIPGPVEVGLLVIVGVIVYAGLVSAIIRVCDPEIADDIASLRATVQ